MFFHKKMEKVTTNQLNKIILRKQSSLKCSEELLDINIKVKAEDEEPSMLEIRQCFGTNDFQEFVNVKDEIEIGDTLLLDRNNFVNNKVEFDIEKGFSSRVNSDEDEEAKNQDESPDVINGLKDETKVDGATHMVAEDKTTTYRCEHCNYTSTRSANIKKHFSAVHEKIKNYKCRHCNFISSYAESIKKHIQGVHMKIKNYKCPHCDFTASFSSVIKQHIRAVHDKIKNFKCEHCDYTASRASSIRKHFRGVHEKIKKYKCEHCDFTTNECGNFNQHMAAVHQKLKKNKCEHCDYNATRADALKKHVQAVHQKIKKFKCDYCDYTSSYSNCIKKHLEAIHHKIEKCRNKIEDNEKLNNSIDGEHYPEQPLDIKIKFEAEEVSSLKFG